MIENERAPVALETRRLLLEAWSDRYVDRYAELLGDEDSMRYLGGPRSVGRAREQYAWYVAHWRTHGFGPRWAVGKETGTWIGMIGLRHLPDEWGDPGDVELGWIVAPEARGHGYGEEGARAMLAFAFAEVGLSSVIARTAAANLPSVRIAEKLGMRLESATGEWRTYRITRAVWLARDRGEAPSGPEARAR